MVYGWIPKGTGGDTSRFRNADETKLGKAVA